jgi:hypothetical protein
MSIIAWEVSTRVNELDPWFSPSNTLAASSVVFVYTGTMAVSIADFDFVPDSFADTFDFVRDSVAVGGGIFLTATSAAVIASGEADGVAP